MVGFCGSCTKVEVTLNGIVAECVNAWWRTKWRRRGLLLASGKLCLSKYDKILLIMIASVMQAMTFTLNFSQTSHWVMSMLNTRFSLCAGDRITKTFCGNDTAFLNLSGVLLNEDYSYYVVKQSPRHEL